MISLAGTPKKFVFGVFLLWCISTVVAVNEKTVNIKLGFEIDPVGDDESPVKLKRRHDASDTGSSDEHVKLLESSSDGTKEEKEKEKSDSNPSDYESDSGSDDTARKSTKGLRMEDYEPERKPKLHERINDDDDDSN